MLSITIKLECAIHLITGVAAGQRVMTSTGPKATLLCWLLWLKQYKTCLIAVIATRSIRHCRGRRGQL